MESGRKENDRLEHVLKKCEYVDQDLHGRLAVLLNELNDKYNVDLEIITEIEEIYIQKGHLLCHTLLTIFR